MYNTERTTIKRFIKYALVYFALAMSTLNLFMNNKSIRYSIILLSFISLFYFRYKLNKKVIWIISFFFILICINLILFNKSISSAFSQFIYETGYYIILPFVLIKFINRDFPKYFVNILYFLCIISLIFWTFSNISQSFYNFTRELPYILRTDPVDTTNHFGIKPEQFIIYTFEPNRIGSIIRNPGQFHEPGAFAVFIIIAIVFNYILHSRLFNLKGIILILTLLTTFSSAGYIAFFILFFSVIISKSNISLLMKVIYISFMLSLSIILYINLDFLSKKIEYQYNAQKNMRLNAPTSGRIFAARKAVNILVKFPFTGKNLLVKQELNKLNSEDAVKYGLMNTATKFGIPVTLMLFYLTYLSLKIFCFQNRLFSNFPKLALVSILLMLTTQSFFISPIILMIVFFSIIYTKRYTQILFSNPHNLRQANPAYPLFNTQ